ncbi:MAG: hypothetical protein HYS12_09885, partial [Planctomycetes bacterium]|nr:hypothetical protein [Planctomycetota bacterium]
EDEFIPHPPEDVGDSFEPAGLEDAGAAGSNRSVEDSVISTLVDQQGGGVPAGEEETEAASGAPGSVDAEDEVETFTAEAGEGVTEEPAAEKEEAEEEEEERRVPPPKPKYGRRWAGGILVGALLGGAACVALWMFRIEPPRGWRVSEETKSGTQPGGTGQKSGAGQPEVKQASLDDLLASGDFSKDPPAINEGDAADRTKRGRYLLLQYLSRTEPKNAKLTDDAVKNALQDLDEAAKQGNADAYLWKGFANEAMNNLQEAQKVYQEGADKFKGDPVQKARFDSALDRVQLQGPAKAAGALLRPPSRFDAAQLALLLLLLQAPGQPPAPGQQPDRPPLEAGVSFWRAARLARDRKYDEALIALAEARKVHDENRRARLYKAQNPTSDPLENIFLRACDELKAYWELQKKFGGGYLAAGKSPADALDAVLADLQKTKKSTDDLKTERDDLAKKKTEADAKITTLETDLGKEKKAKTDAETMVKDRDKRLIKAAEDLAAEKTKLGQALVRAEGLEKEKTDLEKAFVQIGDALKPLGVDPKKGREAMFRKLQDVVKVMKENNAGDKLLKSLEEIRRLTETLGQRWAPETMLNYWLPVLADRAQKDLAAVAVKDVERVRTDDKSGATAKAQALAVEGLAQRNRGDFAKARETLKQAEEAAGTAAWKGLVTKTRKELADPAAFYLPQAEALRGQGRYAEALAVLDEGLKAFPDRSGRLLAVRSLVRLDAAAKVRGKLREDSPGLKEAREDAEAAVKAGSQGAGHFAAGRIAEALGQRDAAATSYRRAVNEAPAGSAELSRYSIALARMLQQQAEGRGALLPGPRGETTVAGRPLSVREMLLMTMVGLQPPSPEELSQKEALDLADKILQRKDIDEQPLLKAQALAIKGQWTEALNTYVEGLRTHLGRDQFEGLKYIVTNHPVQRTPDRLRVPQPFQAERHYLAGLGRYHSRDFANAEKEFALAISNFDQDARYHYFLGLTRLQQGKRGSAEDFDEAARLEADGRPARDAVDTALERIQGELRRLIRDARNRTR